MTASLSDLSAVRDMARRLSLRTQLLALRGDGDGSAASLISALRLARMTEREPVLICWLVKIACLSIATVDVPVVLEYASPSGEALARLEAELAAAEDGADLRRTWIAERVYALQTIRSARSAGECTGRPLPPVPEGWPIGWLGSPFLNTLAVSMLRNHGELIAAAGAGWPEVIDQTKAASDRRHGSMFAHLAMSLNPVDSRVTIMGGRGLASIRSARAAVMIERFRREKGRLPASLAELPAESGKKLPLDPFTGKDLIYRPAQGEYRVFSVGDDRKETPDKPLNTGDSDWGARVRLRRPPAP
jgi:hypothetical protein